MVIVTMELRIASTFHVEAGIFEVEDQTPDDSMVIVLSDLFGCIIIPSPLVCNSYN
jgi:hypothetical protein